MPKNVDFLLVLSFVLLAASFGFLGYTAYTAPEPAYQIACTDGVRVVPMHHCTGEE
jgi:hypothetical protein